MEKATVITGAGRGIGMMIAFRMAYDGPVLLVSRTEADLREVVSAIRSDGGKAEYVVGDVVDLQTADTVNQKLQNLGWVGRNLVCNAGVAKGGPLNSIDLNDWYNMFNVNVHGTYHFIRALLPGMIERQDGSISIIGSIAGLSGGKNDSCYSATKAALNSMAESIALEVKKHNIPVVSICPGYVLSEMTSNSIENLVKYKGISRGEAVKEIANRNPQKRILKPSEVAEAVAFVSSPMAMRYTGKPMTLMGETDPRVLKLVNWIFDQARDAKRLIVPVSGGTDSALVCKLCHMAYPERVMPIFFGKKENLRGAEFFESLAPVTYFETNADEIQRWTNLLRASKHYQGWLVGSRNRTEETLGTYSMASRLATFLPIVNVWKSDVMELCAALGVPQDVIDSSRRADPDCGRPQEMAEIPLETIDAYLKGSKLESQDQMDYLNSIIRYNEFKKYLPKKGP